MFTIKDSVEQAYNNSSDRELKAIIYLSLCKNDKLSKKYLKSLKKLGKFQKRLTKLNKSGRDECNSEVLEKNERLKEYTDIQKECIQEAKSRKEITNTDLISKVIFKAYRQGSGLVDFTKGIRNQHSSYGRIVYNLLEKISSDSLIKKIKKKVKREKSFMQKMKDENPKVSKKEYMNSEEGADYIEIKFILFYLDKLSQDYSSDEKERVIEDLVNEIARDDAAEKDKLMKMYKAGQLGKNFSKIVLQLIRLSVGKGLFMNTAVKVTNVILRFVLRKGMSYGRNAAFRQAIAKYLGSGGEAPNPYTIAIAILMTIPDLISILNPRNYLGLTNTVISLYLLRNYSDK